MRPRHKRRGYTLLEMMVAASISSLIMIAVASLQSISAVQIKNLSGQSKTRQTRMAALDQIRYILMNARVGSCSTQQYGRYIQFRDLNVSKTMNSAFYFVASTRTLYYNKGVTDGIPAVSVLQGPVDIIFTVEKQALVKIWVKSASQKNYGEVDTQDGITKVQLRTANNAS